MAAPRSRASRGAPRPTPTPMPTLAELLRFEDADTGLIGDSVEDDGEGVEVEDVETVAVGGMLYPASA